MSLYAAQPLAAMSSDKENQTPHREADDPFVIPGSMAARTLSGNHKHSEVSANCDTQYAPLAVVTNRNTKHKLPAAGSSKATVEQTQKGQERKLSPSRIPIDVRSNNSPRLASSSRWKPLVMPSPLKKLGFTGIESPILVPDKSATPSVFEDNDGMGVPTEEAASHNKIRRRGEHVARPPVLELNHPLNEKPEESGQDSITFINIDLNNRSPQSDPTTVEIVLTDSRVSSIKEPGNQGHMLPDYHTSTTIGGQYDVHGGGLLDSISRELRTTSAALEPYYASAAVPTSPSNRRHAHRWQPSEGDTVTRASSGYTYDRVASSVYPLSESIPVPAYVRQEASRPVSLTVRTAKARKTKSRSSESNAASSRHTSGHELHPHRMRHRTGTSRNEKMSESVVEEICQKLNAIPRTRSAPTLPITVPTYFDQWSLKYAGPLSHESTNDALLGPRELPSGTYQFCPGSLVAVIAAYDGYEWDEFGLGLGDIFTVIRIFGDGWAFCARSKDHGDELEYPNGMMGVGEEALEKARKSEVNRMSSGSRSGAASSMKLKSSKSFRFLKQLVHLSTTASEATNPSNLRELRVSENMTMTSVVKYDLLVTSDTMFLPLSHVTLISNIGRMIRTHEAAVLLPFRMVEAVSGTERSVSMHLIPSGPKDSSATAVQSTVRFGIKTIKAQPQSRNGVRQSGSLRRSEHNATASSIKSRSQAEHPSDPEVKTVHPDEQLGGPHEEHTGFPALRKRDSGFFEASTSEEHALAAPPATPTSPTQDDVPPMPVRAAPNRPDLPVFESARQQATGRAGRRSSSGASRADLHRAFQDAADGVRRHVRSRHGTVEGDPSQGSEDSALALNAGLVAQRRRSIMGSYSQDPKQEDHLGQDAQDEVPRPKTSRGLTVASESWWNGYHANDDTPQPAHGANDAGEPGDELTLAPSNGPEASRGWHVSLTFDKSSLPLATNTTTAPATQSSPPKPSQSRVYKLKPSASKRGSLKRAMSLRFGRGPSAADLADQPAIPTPQDEPTILDASSVPSTELSSNARHPSRTSRFSEDLPPHPVPRPSSSSSPASSAIFQDLTACADYDPVLADLLLLDADVGSSRPAPGPLTSRAGNVPGPAQGALEKRRGTVGGREMQTQLTTEGISEAVDEYLAVWRGEGLGKGMEGEKEKVEKEQVREKGAKRVAIRRSVMGLRSKVFGGGGGSAGTLGGIAEVERDEHEHDHEAERLDGSIEV